MKRSILVFLTFLISSSLFGQTDSLNQKDANGLKQGTWIVYLDANWKKVQNSGLASYSRYTYYKNDGNLYPMASWGKKGFQLKKNGVPVNPTVGKPILLDGEYRWYDKKNRLISTHRLKQGNYQSYEYFYKSGILKGAYRYTEQCGDTPFDYCILLYNKDGSIKNKVAVPSDKTGKPLNKE